MTWKEIKQAVETAGVKENDEILFIECELRDANDRAAEGASSADH